MNELVANQQLVQAIWDAVNTSSGSLENIAPLVRRLIETQAWKRREVSQLGQVVEFKSFADFIVTPPLKGCGWPLDKVGKLIEDDPEVAALYREATTASVGRPINTDNVSIITTKHGNTKAYTLTRLKRQRPDLFDRIVAGELSANAAAIAAGFRKKPIKHCPNCGHEWR